MPMYDFECRGCGHTFETVAKLDETVECPSCKSTDTTRLMGAPIQGGQAALKMKFGPFGGPNHKKGGRPTSD
jgi:putative FmdB family regulatory protein